MPTLRPKLRKVARRSFSMSGAERVSRVAEWPDWNEVSAVRDNARQVEFKAESAGFEE
jgi:hypothetical protein